MFKWMLQGNVYRVYEKYSCLWNPYHKDYHNCFAKNVALKSVIRSLKIPQLTPTDCLHQIKIIRQKYGDEQLRRIRNMRMHTTYKAPYSWCNVMTRMLEKVIKDEDNYNTSKVLRSPVSDTYLRPDQLLKSETEVKFKRRTQKPLSRSRFQRFPCAVGINQYDCQRGIKSVENLIGIRETSNKKHDEKSGVSKATANFRNEGKKPKSVIDTNDPKLLGLLECPSCGWEEFEPGRKLHVCIDGSSTDTNGMTVFPCHRYINDTPDIERPYSVQCDTATIKKSQNNIGTITEKTDTSSISTQANHIKENVNKGVQCVEESKATGNIDVRPTLIAELGKYPTRCTKEQAVMTREFNTAGVQCSEENCPSKKESRSISAQCLISAEQCTTCEKHVQMCAFSVSDKGTAVRCESNVAEMNTYKCLNAEVQCTILEPSKKIDNVSDICNVDICAHEAAKNMNECPILTYVMLHCLEKVLHLGDKYKIHVVASFLKEKFNLRTSSESNDADCHSCAAEAQDNSAIGTLTKMFLEILSRAMDLDNKHAYLENDNSNCIADARFNRWTQEIFKKIDSCLSKILELDKFTDTFRYQINEEVSPRRQEEDKSQECEDDDVQTDVVSSADNKDYHDYQGDTAFLESIVEESVPKENKAVYVRVDTRDVGSHADGCISIVLRCNKGTQILPTSLTDSSVATVPDISKEKISMGTQKRDPILVRVIRCNNEHEIMELDKDVFTSDANNNISNERKNLHDTESGHVRRNNNMCQKNCRAPSDWTNVYIDQPSTASKIPINFHKHARRKDLTDSLKVRPRKCSGICQG